jgi:hypothetical protein
VAVWRPSTGLWWIRTSKTNYAGYFIRGWGDPTFIATPADYDGDGRTDIAVWRPSTGGWWVLTSASEFTSYTSFFWGGVGNLPLTMVR